MLRFSQARLLSRIWRFSRFQLRLLGSSGLPPAEFGSWFASKCVWLVSKKLDDSATLKTDSRQTNLKLNRMAFVAILKATGLL